MRVASSGVGPRPVILVHGFGANHRFWRKWTPALAERATVFGVDLIDAGEGRSASVHSPLAQAADLARLVRSVGSGVPPVLVGHSLGGGIALAATLELMDDPGAPAPAGLVLVSGAVLPQKLPRYMSLARRRGIGEIFLIAAPPRPILRFGLRGLVADSATVDDGQVDAYREPLRDRSIRRAVLQTARALDLEDARMIADRAPEVRVPTLLIWGSEDRIVPPENADRLARLIPETEVVMLKGVGHLPPEEAPDRSLAPLLRFLDAIGRAPDEDAPSPE